MAFPPSLSASNPFRTGRVAAVTQPTYPNIWPMNGPPRMRNDLATPSRPPLAPEPPNAPARYAPNHFAQPWSYQPDYQAPHARFAMPQSPADSDAGEFFQSLQPPPSFHTHPVPHYPAPQYPPQPPPQPYVPPPTLMHSSVSGHVADMGPVPKPFHLNTSGWSEADKLSISDDNWLPWSARVGDELGMQPGAWRFLHRDHVPPSFLVYPSHHRAWVDSDRVVRSYLSACCTSTEREHIKDCATASSVWETLQARHLQTGPVGQIKALKKFFAIKYGNDPSTFEKTTKALGDLNTAIWAAAPPDAESFLAVGMLSALSGHPAFVNSLLAQPALDLRMIKDRLTSKQAFPGDDEIGSAFAASGSREVCSTPSCPKPSTHTWPYCTTVGGGMAGKTVPEAQAKYRSDRGLPPAPPRSTRNGNTANSMDKHVKRDDSGRAYITSHGQDFYLPAATSTVIPATPVANYINLQTDELPTPTEPVDLEAWLACEQPRVSLDWNDWTVNAATAGNADDFVIFADTGANIHITPFRGDFLSFSTIAPRAISGFQGSSIDATGLGTILTDRFELEYALYVPKAAVRLLSVLRLCQAKKYTFHFDDAAAWITDATENIVCTGSVHPTRNLYRLHCKPLPLSASPATASPAIASARDLRSWHLCMGHTNHQAVADMYQNRLVDGMVLDPSSDTPVCDACIRGKQARTAVPKVREGPKSTRKLEKVHVDLSGKKDVQSRSGNNYTLDIVDDCTSHGWSIPIPNKAAAFTHLTAWQLAIESETGERVLAYVLDNGELKSTAFDNWCTKRAIRQVWTPPHVSKMNGKCERYHRTVDGKARAMRLGCDAPLYLWDEFVVTAAYLHARTPSTSQDGRTPYECFNGRKPNLSHLREIGCRAFVLIETHNPKLNARSIECVLIGYTPRSKSYRCWERPTGKVYNSYNVRFIESWQTEKVSFSKELLAQIPAPPASPTDDGVPDDQLFPDPIMRTSAIPSTEDPMPSTVVAAPAIPDSLTHPTPAPPRRSTRVRKPVANAAADECEDDGEMEILHDWETTIAETPEDDDGEETALWAELNAYITEYPIDVEYPDDPRNHSEAMASPDRDKWIAGTHEELGALRKLGVYELIHPHDVPLNKTILDVKPVYTRKRDMTGAVSRNKVRYCIKGYRQIYGRDYTVTTSPTARLESFRAVLHIAANKGWDLQQIDVKTAFLNASLPPDEIQYARQPKHYEEPGKESWIWKVVKSLYGLKQAGRSWNRTMHDAMIEWGFKRLICEWCVYVRRTPDGVTNLVAVHVDDMLCAASEAWANTLFKDQLRTKWEISDLGEVRFCLGIGIVRDPERRTISLSQTALIDKIVTQFHQTDAYPVSTPMEAKLPLTRPTDVMSREDAERLANTPYRALVGCLMYVSVATRPDIAFAVNRLASFLDCYRKPHWQAAIRVLRYLKGTRLLALELGGTDPISLNGYTDADFANDIDQRKSVMGYTFSLGSGSISWASRKQKVVTLSSTEAEYIGASEASKEGCWLRTLIRGMTIPIDSPTAVRCDNNATISLSGDPSCHSRVKHIDNRYHHIRDCVEKKKIFLPRVSSFDNVADTLTKALPAPDFLRHRSALGLVLGGV